MNNTIEWTDQSQPIGLSIDQLLYRIRQGDAKEGLIFDSVTLDDIYNEEGVELLAFDALVFTYSVLRRKMNIVMRTLNRAGGSLDVAAMQVSDPFKRNGVAQVAVVFELSDGQTVSVYFHNPDSTPGRLAPKDEMISWKWMLNKKDITIVVAPERGNDIAIREVSRRIMKLADKNSAAFAKTNAKRAERLENISNMKGEIETLEAELEDLNKQIAIVRIEKESEALKPKASTAEGLSFLESIKSFIGRSQYRTISNAMRGEEKEFFIDKARVLADIINGMAKTYEQDGKGLESKAYLHYFKGSSDWYITEKDMQGGTAQAFGYAKLSQGGEMGYISIDELTKGDVELDLHFDPQALSSAIGKVGDKPQDSSGKMTEARNMVSSVLAEFGGSISAWEALPGAVAPWDYASVTIGDIELRAGVSSGGVVSINGKPHDPEGRVIDTPDALRATISALLPVADLSYELGKDGVTAMDEDQFKAEIAKLEEDNLRSQALVLLAKRKGTDDQISRAEAILTEHDNAGSATPELIERREALRAELEQVKQEAPVSEVPAAAITVTDDVIVPEGSESKVKTAKGTEIATGFTVIEADKLIASHDSVGNPNPDYPQELQPRDRSRTSSVAWVRKVSKQLDPDSLGKTRRADSGAPIIGADGVVESGNGRTMAIQEAYRNGDAGEYREWLESEAEFYGLDAEKIKAMRAPVLVRVRTSSIDRRTFAIEANQDDKLAMTGTEKAKADADRLDSGLMSTLSDDGNLLAASNRSFVIGFLQSLGESESAQYMTTNGQPTGALIARIQAAVFAKAYNDDRLLELSADVTKPEVANVIEALNVAAPEFILARNADEDAAKTATNQIVDSVETAMNQQAIEAIIQATNLVRQSRADGTSVEDAVNQMGLFGDISPATAAMALFINKNNRSAKRLGVAFKAMAEFVKQEAERGQTVDMFGDATPVELSDIIAAANRKLDEEYGEGAYAIDTLDMFSPQAEPELATDVQDDLDEARAQTETDPTEKQKESGEYAKGELSAFGLDIVIENPKGSVRSKKSKTSGEEWSVSMAHDYGYIKGTKGLDGDEVDVFVGPALDSEVAYVIEQVDQQGKLDEHKVMLGFGDEESAKQGYLSSYQAGWDGLGSIKSMSLEDLKVWLAAAGSGTSPQVEPADGPEPDVFRDGDENAAMFFNTRSRSHKRTGEAYQRAQARGDMTTAQAKQVREFYSGDKGAEQLNLISMEHGEKSIADLMQVIIDTGLGRQPSNSADGIIGSGNISVGDKVVWRNEFGTIKGIFRGFADDNQKAVIVANGSQMSAPASEVFYDNEPESELEPAPQTNQPADSQVSKLDALMKLAPKAGEAIRADDPAAIEKLEAKLNYLQALAALMRDANKHVRKQNSEGLAAMGLNEKTIAALYEPDFAGNIGFAKYKMTNNSGEIGRTKRRLAQLVKEREAQNQQEAEAVQDTPEISAASEDAAFLQSVVSGAVADILAPETGDKITAVLERNIENEDMAELLEQAVMAYQTQVEQATADI